MPHNDEIVATRHKRIVEALSTEALTTKELAERFGANYHTIRRDVKVLVKEARIRPTGLVKESSPTYVAGGQRPMPVFHHPSTGRDLTLHDVAGNYVRYVQTGVMPSGMLAALNLTKSAAILAMEAESAKLMDGKASPQTLEMVKRELTKIINDLNSFSSVARQMLDNANLWDANSLVDITEDHEWNSEYINKAVIPSLQGGA